MGNAYVNFEDNRRGTVDYHGTHAFIFNEIYDSIISSCKLSVPMAMSGECRGCLAEANKAIGTIYHYNIYAPICNPSYSNESYSASVKFLPKTDQFLHKVSAAKFSDGQIFYSSWSSTCAQMITYSCTRTGQKSRDLFMLILLVILPVAILQEVISLPSRLCSTQSAHSLFHCFCHFSLTMVRVTSTRYLIKKIRAEVKTFWYPRYSQGEVRSTFQLPDHFTAVILNTHTQSFADCSLINLVLLRQY